MDQEVTLARAVTRDLLVPNCFSSERATCGEVKFKLVFYVTGDEVSLLT